MTVGICISPYGIPALGADIFVSQSGKISSIQLPTQIISPTTAKNVHSIIDIREKIQFLSGMNAGVFAGHVDVIHDFCSQFSVIFANKAISSDQKLAAVRSFVEDNKHVFELILCVIGNKSENRLETILSTSAFKHNALLGNYAIIGSGLVDIQQLVDISIADISSLSKQIDLSQHALELIDLFLLI